MEKVSLKQAIAAIYDMELNNYYMTRAMQQLEEESRRELPPDLPYPINKPIKPEDPFSVVSNESMETNPVVGAITGAFGGALLGLAVNIVVYLFSALFLDKGEGILDNMLTFIGIGAAVCAVLFIPYSISERKKVKLSYKQKIEQYEKDQARYHRYLEDAKLERVASDKRNAARKAALAQQKEQMRCKMRESEDLLIQLYDMVGLDRKFRNIVPVAYMYEFVKLGVSTKLDGTDGLYYLTMQELRMDQMQYKLDTIIDKLDTLIDQQHSIYRELTSINRRCDDMIAASVRNTDAILAQNNLISDQNEVLKQISTNTAVAAYNAERVAKEQEYQSYMVRYQSW